jgi:DNA mismatch repair protein MutH
MERQEAIRHLKELEGKDLRSLAERYGVTVWTEGHVNKGWAGHVCERHLGLPLNSAQSPNFGSWELKVVPLKRLKSGNVVLKETMAITMIDPVHVAQTTFEVSHLLAKLRKMVVCARMFESKQEEHSLLVRVGTFDLDDEQTLAQVRDDYNLVRDTLRLKGTKHGFDALTGRMGVLVQPRTKGPGHREKRSRAFYARKKLVAIVLDDPGLAP